MKEYFSFVFKTCYKKSKHNSGWNIESTDWAQLSGVCSLNSLERTVSDHSVVLAVTIAIYQLVFYKNQLGLSGSAWLAGSDCWTVNWMGYLKLLFLPSPLWPWGLNLRPSKTSTHLLTYISGLEFSLKIIMKPEGSLLPSKQKLGDCKSFWGLAHLSFSSQEPTQER